MQPQIETKYDSAATFFTYIIIVPLFSHHIPHLYLQVNTQKSRYSIDSKGMCVQPHVNAATFCAQVQHNINIP